jgi:asparagine synthase (glutamine-hydrolysing)
MSAHPFPMLVDRLAHRGPDATGIFEDQFAGQDVKLGHRRLSIIDLSVGANQPFEKDGLVLVYNGELYNYRQLRSEIEKFGVTFQTTSDTEVVLEAWRLWGAECLLRFRGMFAFALYNRRNGAMVLARDPFGIKPLFILRKAGGWPLRPSSRRCFPCSERTPRLTTAASLPRSSTVGCLMNSVCIGKCPNCSRGNGSSDASTERFQSIPIGIRSGRWSNRTAGRSTIDELRHVLKDTVSAHMVADVPVATFLSGGLDSSLITVLARQQVDRLDCFTIAFRPEDQKFEAMPDDLRYAREVALMAGVNLHEIVIRPDLAEILPQMVETLDEPIGDGAAINAYLICKGARDLGIKVLLSGMGADEIFAGYRRHYACLLAARYRRLPEVLRSGLIEPLMSLMPAAGRDRGYRTLRWAKRFHELRKFAGRASLSSQLRISWTR